MACHRIWALALGLLCAGASPAPAGGPPARRGQDDVSRLAARIDALVDATLARARVKPAPPADDSAFLRRLSLDVTGKVPHVAQARRFLADRSPDKRAKVVERRLDSPGYVNHFTNTWRDLLLPEANADFQRRFLLPGLEGWLRKQFRDNVGYDRMVRELLTVPMRQGRDAMLELELAFRGGGRPSPLAFYMAKEGKPEELAAATARLFLGVRIECAQCHNHPFGKWRREDFWGQAAFFAGIRRPRGMQFPFGPLSEVSDRRELPIPGTERVAQAKFLDGKEPRWKFRTGARATLAEWMTAKDNPFFARTAADRLWAHFFGVGLVDPVDDFSDTNLPSHPELLDELARAFAEHDFDFKFLVRAITRSKAYQRSSVHPDRPPPGVRLFARMPVKGLTPEQLFDSLCMATGLRDDFRGRQRFFAGTPRQQFLDVFDAPAKRTEVHTSIPQALALMNNKLIADATHPDRGEVLGAVANATFMTTAGQVETLFLAALSRKPTEAESAKFVRYVERGGVSGSRKKALGDVFWALLNSTEFILNH